MVDKNLNNLMSLIPQALKKAIIERMHELDPETTRFFDRSDLSKPKSYNFIVAEKLPVFITTVCRDLYDIDIQTPKRDQRIVELRQMATWILRRCAKDRLTLQALGKFFNKQNHATVLYSYRKCEDLVLTSSVYRAKLGLICSELADRGYVDAMVEFIDFLKSNGKDIPQNVVLSQSLKEILQESNVIEKSDDRDSISDTGHGLESESVSNLTPN
jgi:hypothetical protein